MTSKIKYIKRNTKYIIGAAVLATSLGSAVFGGAVLPPLTTLDKLDDYYIIRNADDLEEFARLVNEGRLSFPKGKIVQDIEVNKGPENDGKQWTPIGTYEHPFYGELIGDGEIKKITGLYVNNKEDYQGFIGYLGCKAMNGLHGIVNVPGTVKNIEVADSHIYGKDYVGGIAGENQGYIINCITDNNLIKGENNVGGTVGENNRCVTNCRNNGGYVAGGYCVGGNIGLNGEALVEGILYNKGEVMGKEKIGGNVGKNSYMGTIGDGGENQICENEGIIKGLCMVGGNIGCNIGKGIDEMDDNEEEADKKEGIYSKCLNKGAVKGIDDLTTSDGKPSSVYIGGNIGYNNGIIRGKCSTEKEAQQIEGRGAVGGNIGYNEGIIKDHATCDINEIKVLGKCIVGGNIGYNKGFIRRHCKNTNSEVSGIEVVGGNIGYNKKKSTNLISGKLTHKCINKGGNVLGEKKEKVGVNIGCNNCGEMGGFENEGAKIAGEEVKGDTNNIGLNK